MEMGHGPVVILLHGFPELWYIWKYQVSLTRNWNSNWNNQGYGNQGYNMGGQGYNNNSKSLETGNADASDNWRRDAETVQKSASKGNKCCVKNNKD